MFVMVFVVETIQISVMVSIVLFVCFSAGMLLDKAYMQANIFQPTDSFWDL